mmetsp:Transcript_15440/g.31347  ORF Transcript_15440/g.31347 Transcript_15440/m.31347 type:complete len:80 (-) Transcript_15440:452-691(-)
MQREREKEERSREKLVQSLFGRQMKSTHKSKHADTNAQRTSHAKTNEVLSLHSFDLKSPSPALSFSLVSGVSVNASLSS